MNLRGQELLAQSLCRFAPSPGKRLVAALRGVQVVHSYEQDGWMDLTIQVPRQTPNCEVREVAAVAPPLPATAATAPAALAPSVPANEPVAPIVVRRNKGEY
jgi:hypothetical protein